jgi:WD repeat-containing protein 35
LKYVKDLAEIKGEG